MNETMNDVTIHNRVLVQRDANLHISRRAVFVFSRSSNLQRGTWKLNNYKLKPRLHQIQSCGRIQVSRTSNLHPSTCIRQRSSRGYNITCIHVAVTTILSPIQDTCRRRQAIQMEWIRVDTTCIRATCIRCKCDIKDTGRAVVSIRPILVLDTVSVSVLYPSPNSSCHQGQCTIRQR